MTIAMPVLQGRWCPSCGVALAWEEEVCHHCGLPLEVAWRVDETTDDRTAAFEVVAPGSQTVEDREPSGPLFESAIPAEDDPTSKVARQEEMPHASRVILAACASALLVGGLALAITHPWNPDRYDISATEEVDTSMAGFPGTRETLTGQDLDPPAEEQLTGDEARLAQLTEAYELLARYAERAGQSEELFLGGGLMAGKEDRTDAKHEADALAIDVSNLIEELSQLDTSTDTYVEQQEHLLTLANWLRNRVDALVAAWEQAVESDDPAAEEQRLRALLESDRGEDGKGSYQRLFDENYEAWNPAAGE